jgi:hypothetical protein
MLFCFGSLCSKHTPNLFLLVWVFQVVIIVRSDLCAEEKSVSESSVKGVDRSRSLESADLAASSRTTLVNVK